MVMPVGIDYGFSGKQPVAFNDTIWTLQVTRVDHGFH